MFENEESINLSDTFDRWRLLSAAEPGDLPTVTGHERVERS